MRYAANDPVAAARERFVSRRVAGAHADLWLVRLERPPPALHLTHQRNLDALGLDDRLWDRWDGDPPPIVYRTRTMPTARSIAFHQSTEWHRVEAGRLSEATSLLVELIVGHGFDVPDAWLR